jgi:hypothetical protein
MKCSVLAFRLDRIFTSAAMRHYILFGRISFLDEVVPSSFLVL